MSDIVEFLRARLAEDEQVARDRWNRDGATSERFHATPYDPPRVIREVEAKRLIVELHTGEHDCPEIITGTYPAEWPAAAPWGAPGQPWRHPTGEHFEADDPCPTLRALAAAHSDHRGYRQEWTFGMSS